ncbi:MAG: polyphosphate kinase 1 [bacterium]|nr:polyphosphate kinase 1 [bacterium]
MRPPETFPQPVEAEAGAERFVNRELSLLAFQRRVLDQARDSDNPLLERIKFLAIVGSNLDEFFMVRVAGLKQQLDAGVVDTPPDGLTPAQQLAAVRTQATALLADCQACLRNELTPALEKEGISVLEYRDLTERQKESAKRYFDETIFPVLTPLAFDPGRPFPHISNLSSNLAIIVRKSSETEHFARLKLPSTLPRFVPLKRSSGGMRKDGTVPHRHQFVRLDQVIEAHLPELFPGMEVVRSHPFRIVRDADNEIQELEASDLLESIEHSVRERRFGQVVMLAMRPDMPAELRQLLVRNLGVTENDVYEIEGPLGLSSLMSLCSIDRHDLKEKPARPGTPVRLSDVGEDVSNLFDVIGKHDVLLHHPYDSFSSVVEFLQTAARDPQVMAIKQTLYRVGPRSPVVRALLEARQRGKEVAVLVELKARFDEESNIEWARALERQGVHVIYGLLGLKTHSKIALVVRREGDGIRRYVHLSTGNYNAVTAQLYTDIGYFTCDPEIGADASDLFNYVTGYSTKEDYRKLLVAPIQLRERLEQLIRREIDHHREGRGGRIVFKMNSLVDRKMIELLYEASSAGVEIELLVRGICCLRPGLPGISENIRVTSIVGRFLEHSRVYYFANGGEAQVYLGSADLMPRNLDHRVEVLFPVEDAEHVRYLHDTLFALQLTDNVKARRMQPDGSYVPVERGSEDEAVSCQAKLLAARAAD